MARGAVDPTTWRLRVVGGRQERLVSLDEIRALPRHEETTELKCIEGWSVVVHWIGAGLADLTVATGLDSRSGRPADAADRYEYVSMRTPDGRYYVGLDAPSAFHPQTLLCDGIDGQPLTPPHGAPLRLVITLKYGIKHIKNIGTGQFTDRRPTDYWADRGSDWYAGH